MSLNLMMTASAMVLVLAGGAAAQSVGVAAAVNQTVRGSTATTAPRTLALGDAVIHNEKIDTDGKGLLQILLADGTSFTVGPNSSLTIDSFVYDPGADRAKIVATLGKGVFRFIGGRASKADGGVVLNAPIGVVGIRGGIADFDFSGRGGPSHIDMLFGDSLTLTSHGRVVGAISRAGYSMVWGATGEVGVIKTPPGWVQKFQQQVASLGGGRRAGGSPSAGRKLAAVFKRAVTAPPAAVAGGLADAAGPEGGVADANQFPPPIVLPAGAVGAASWQEIYASSLADSYATYLGRYDLVVAATDLPGAATNEATGSFSLAYHLGTSNGAGVFTVNQPDNSPVPPALLGSPVKVAVAPLSPTSSGDASFGADLVVPSYFVPNVQAPPEEIAGTLHVLGSFNDMGGVGQGVSGNINYQVNYPTFVGPDNLVYANGQTTLTGSFAGSLDKTSPTP